MDEMGLFGSVTDKLFKAAGAGDAASVVRYASRGADVNARNAFDRTPLTVAVYRPSDERLVLATVAALLVRGADVNQCDGAQNTALIFASWKGYTRVVEKLLAAGAEIDRINSDGNSALIWACLLGHSAVAEKLLDAGASVDVAGPGGKTALHFAAAKGHTQIASLLLKRGADPLAVSEAGRSAIAIAESASHPRMTELLRTSSMRSGSSFHSTLSGNDTMFSTTLSEDLVAATAAQVDGEDEEEGEEEVETIVPEENWNAELLESAAAGDPARVASSLAAGAHVDTTNAESATPLVLAARHGHVDAVRALLAARANVNAADVDGNTALTGAARAGHVDVVAALLAAGANVHLANQNAETAAAIAAARDDVAVVRALVESDASLLESSPERPSLLHCAAASTASGGAGDATPRVFTYLTQERGADIHAVDGHGESVLHAAVKADAHALVGTLLALGARVDQHVYLAARSPSMQATLLRHNHALYSERCIALLNDRDDAPPTTDDLTPLVPLLTSVYDLRWLLTLVSMCGSDDAGRAELLHAAFDHILAMKLVFDTPACAYFKMMLENCTEAQWLPRLEVLNLDREAENINTESAAWVIELKRHVQENAWRLDAHEQCLKQVVDGVHELHAMVVENRRAVRATITQIEAVQEQVTAAKQLHAQLARHTSRAVEELHERLAACEENVVHVAASLQHFRDAVVGRQEQEDRRRKLKMVCGVVASVAGFVLAPVVKEIADAVVDLTNPVEIVQYVYGEQDIVRFLADKSSKRLPSKAQDQLAAFEITTDEFEALLREEIVLKNPQLLEECDTRQWCVVDVDGGRAETAKALAPTIEKERTAVLEITAELRFALRLVEEQQQTQQQQQQQQQRRLTTTASTRSMDKYRSPSIDLDDMAIRSLSIDSKDAPSRSERSAPSAMTPPPVTPADGATNQRELVVFVDNTSAFPYHAAVEQSRGDEKAFKSLMERIADADLNAEMRMRLCAVATSRGPICAAQYAYYLGYREVGDLLASRMDPVPTFASTAAAMAVELVGETDHVPYIEIIHDSEGDAERCEHFLAIVDATEDPLDATVEADVVRVVSSSSVTWSAVRYASHLGYVEVVTQLIRALGRQLPMRQRMDLMSQALAQREKRATAPAG